MKLSVEQIRSRIDQGDLIVNPILNPGKQFETAKIDLRLDNKFYRMKAEKRTHHDTIKSYHDLFEEIAIPYEGEDAEFILHPGEFALAGTYETIGIPEDLLGTLGGRSSLARQGIVVHATASVIDPGFVGYITLELTNFGDIPVKLHPLQRIGAITFSKIDGEVKPYGGRIRGVGPPIPEGHNVGPVLRKTLPESVIEDITSQ